VPLKIVCANNEDADFKRLKDEAAGIMSPAEIIRGLDKILKDMQSKEENDKKQIEGFATSPDRLDQRPTEVAGYFDTIATNELTHAGQLQTYVIKLGNVTGDLVQLKEPLTKLYDTIRLLNDTEVDNPALNSKNIVYQANEAKKTILGPPAQSDQQIRGTLQKFLPLMTETIMRKKSLIDLIPTIVKITTPCPSGKTEENAYYLCSEINLTKENPAWQSAAERQCLTTIFGQTCYRLPAENNCDGVTTKDVNYNCQPEQPGCTGGFTPYQADPSKGEQPRVCPTKGQICCRKTVTGLEKLLALKKLIRDFQQFEKSFIDQLDRKYHRLNRRRKSVRANDRRATSTAHTTVKQHNTK
jgi:hypothetical protein